MVLVSQSPEKPEAFGCQEKAVDAAQVIQEALDKNPDVRLVLGIAMRARETEAKEAPRELNSANEVTAVPTHTQCGW